METIRLFDKDSFIKEFGANVLSCEKEEQGYRIILDQTAFFPEGGGQSADTGKLNDVNVLDVQETKGVISHLQMVL